ncbi:MAG: cytochrome d ubiquinol oxidase subunit II [Chloroflexota bacterium]
MSLSLEMLTAGLALLALTAYAVLAGADFGGGVWDFFARGPRANGQRRAIAEAMGPVWEANHVWLIFLLVILFTGFPVAFSALSVALFIPFHLLLVGIILRGAAFVFRAHGSEEAGPQRVWARAFGSASIITPVLLGMCLGAISAGEIRISGSVVQVNYFTAWLTPLSWACGALALALFAYLAAVYLTLETSGELREDFRQRTLISGGVVVAISVLLLPLLVWQAPRLAENLLSVRALPVLVLGVIFALLSLWAVLTRRFAIARVTAVAEVIMLLWGWAFAQWPYVIYPDLTLEASAAPDATLGFLLATAPIGALLLIPSLWLLFSVFKGRNPEAGEAGKMAGGRR